MNEKILKKLFRYGFIRPDKRRTLLAMYRSEGLSPAFKDEIIDCLSMSVEMLGTEENSLLVRKKKAEKNYRAAKSGYEKELDHKYLKLVTLRKEEIWRRKKQKAHLTQDIFNELERFDRRIGSVDEQIERSIEEKNLEKIRKNFG